VKTNQTFRLESFLLFSLSVAVAAFLLLRSAGLLPAVFADEYLYSKLARQLPLSVSTIPDYLYLYIYKYTNICGSGFLECARIINILFFVGAAPFIYKSSKHFVSSKLSVFIAVLAIVGPINTYTTYFMPESFYFFAFWAFSCFALQLECTSRWYHWSFAGFLFGLSALVKPHSLFFAPAIAGYCIYVSKNPEEKWARSAVQNTTALLFAGLATKLLIGFVLAGAGGVTLFGATYSSFASSTASSNIQGYFNITRFAATSILGHILGITLLFGLSICIAVFHFVKVIISRRCTNSDQKISLFTIAIIANMIVVVGLFTASIASTNPDHSVARLHMRYYDFAFPLLMIVGATQISTSSQEINRKWRLSLSIPVICLVLYAAATRMVPYTPDIVDSPELTGFIFNPEALCVLTGISLVSLILWIFSARAGARILVYIFLPTAVILSSYYTNHELRRRLVPDVFDRAGIFAKLYLPNADLSKLTVVGSDPAGLFRTLFYLDSKKVSSEVIPKGSAYDTSKLSKGKEWILVIGDHALPKHMPFQLQMNNFALALTTGIYTIDFRQSSWPGIISRSYGLSGSEPGGTWSSGDVVTLIFSKSLPKEFTVKLVAYAFGPNVGEEFIALVGNTSKKFTLGISDTNVNMDFVNPTQADTLRIYVPSPISPKELGISEDPRRLGIGLKELIITPK